MTPASPWMGSHMKAHTLGSARAADRAATSLKGTLLKLGMKWGFPRSSQTRWKTHITDCAIIWVLIGNYLGNYIYFSSLWNMDI